MRCLVKCIELRAYFYVASSFESYFLFKDTVQSVCAEEIRKVSVSVRCFSELYVKHILLHTSTFYIYIIIFSADI